MGQFFVFLVVGPRDGPHIGHLFICRSSLRPPLLTPTIQCNWPSSKASTPPVSIHMRITGRAAIQTSAHCGGHHSTEPRHCDAFLLSHLAESAAIWVSADRGALTPAHFNSLPMYSGIPTALAYCGLLLWINPMRLGSVNSLIL